MEPKKGFTVTADVQQHLFTVQLWGWWDAPMANAFLQEIQRQAHTLVTDGNDWYLLLDVTDQIAPMSDIVQMIQEGLNALNGLRIPKQALVVKGMIPHFLAQARAPNPPIISYFQSQEDALHWLFESEEVSPQ